MPQFLQSPTDNARHFRVALVEEAALPQGAEGDHWCRYVIENAHATMTGWRRGSLQDVTHYARGYTEELNTHRTPSASLWTGRRRIESRVAESVPPSPGGLDQRGHDVPVGP